MDDEDHYLLSAHLGPGILYVIDVGANKLVKAIPGVPADRSGIHARPKFVMPCSRAIRAARTNLDETESATNSPRLVVQKWLLAFSLRRSNYSLNFNP
jgi:hypothetical protein